MPRVTQREQYKRHLLLQTIWSDPSKQACLTTLSGNEQRKLHTFYQPSEELTPKQFRNHLHAIQRDHPQLRHVSGKLYRRVELAFAQHARQLQAGQKEQARGRTGNKVPVRRGGRVVVYGVVRPKPDLNKLLKAMIEMTREEQDKGDKSNSRTGQ